MDVSALGSSFWSTVPGYAGQARVYAVSDVHPYAQPTAQPLGAPSVGTLPPGYSAEGTLATPEGRGKVMDLFA